MDDERRRRFSGEAVNRLQFHHLVSHGADDAPAASGRAGRHRQSAGDHDPIRHVRLVRHLEKRKPARKIAKIARIGPGKKCERDDAHRFLRIVGAVAVAHEPGADELGFAEDLAHEERAHLAKQSGQQEHEHGAAHKSEHRRGEHGEHDLMPQTDPMAFGVGRRPDQLAPIVMGGGERGAAKPANQRMTRTRREPQPPRQDIPEDCPEESRQDDVEIDELQINHPLAYRPGYGRAEG